MSQAIYLGVSRAHLIRRRGTRTSDLMTHLPSSQVYSPSPSTQVILAEMSRRLGGRDTLGMDDMTVKYIFGYCRQTDCTGSAAKTWLSGWQTSPEFQYLVPLLPPGPVTLVACAADVFRGVITVVEDCEKATVQVASSQEVKDDSVPGCLPCSGELDTSTPREALNCLLASASTCSGVGGGGMGEVEQLLGKAGTLLDSETLDRGLLSAVLQAVDSAMTLEPRSSPLLHEAIVLLRLGTYRIQEAAAGSKAALIELADSVLHTLSRASDLYGALSAVVDDSAGDLDSSEALPVDRMGCSFVGTVMDIKNKAAMSLLEFLPIGAETFITSDDLRLAVAAVDIDGGAGDRTYTLSANEIDDGNRRRKGLRRSLRAVAANAAPEVDIPSGLLNACQAYPRDICPQPMLIEMSYTRDATFLLSGMGHAKFVSTAARFAGVDEEGLSATLVSGMLGLRFASLGPHQSGTGSLLNSSAALHFPLDTQV